MDNWLQLEKGQKSFQFVDSKLQTRALTIVVGLGLLCLNIIFYLLQDFDDSMEEFQRNIGRIGQNFKVFGNLDNSFMKFSDEFTKHFINAVKNLINPEASKRVNIGRVMLLIRSGINVLAIIPLIYCAFRYDSTYVLIGFIYWCTQLAFGWPLPIFSAISSYW